MRREGDGRRGRADFGECLVESGGVRYFQWRRGRKPRYLFLARKVLRVLLTECSQIGGVGHTHHGQMTSKVKSTRDSYIIVA